MNTNNDPESKNTANEEARELKQETQINKLFVEVAKMNELFEGLRHTVNALCFSVNEGNIKLAQKSSVNSENLSDSFIRDNRFSPRYRAVLPTPFQQRSPSLHSFNQRPQQDAQYKQPAPPRWFDKDDVSEEFFSTTTVIKNIEKLKEKHYNKDFYGSRKKLVTLLWKTICSSQSSHRSGVIHSTVPLGEGVIVTLTRGFRGEMFEYPYSNFTISYMVDEEHHIFSSDDFNSTTELAMVLMSYI